MRPFFYLLFLCSHISLFGQTYPDHFGTGNNVGVTTTSSPIQNIDSTQNSLDGTGFILDTIGAARFLAQATLGANMDDIDTLTQMTIEEWFDWQVNMPYTPSLNYYEEILDTITSRMEATFPDSIGTFNFRAIVSPSAVYSSYAFYQKTFTENDMLRQKVAFALSQIFVVSRQGFSPPAGDGFCDYYDILLSESLGNFRALLYDITMHPIMGIYLTYWGNSKSNGITEPDENFAREIMQLFTIGLHELNNDGTYKLSNLGDKIPTYDNEDIKNLARVFTGLYAGAFNPNTVFGGWCDSINLSTTPTGINDNLILCYDYTEPMQMLQNHHDTELKIVLGDTILQNQTGEEDINQAIDILFNHPNVGPFISYRLIQQLVKSNPSPAYINRVATAFNNNGFGVRGDMLAVVKAILTDPEARDCDLIEDVSNGRLLQPIERLTRVSLAFNIEATSYNSTNNFWFQDSYEHPDIEKYFGYKDKLRQAFLQSPTVFNFFTPFYADSDLEPGLVSPEFEILDAVSLIHYMNFARVIPKRPFFVTNRPSISFGALWIAETENYVDLVLSEEVNILAIEGQDALIERLNVLLCGGTLQQGTKDLISIALTQLSSNNITGLELVEDAITLVMMTPEFLIIK